MSVRAPAPVVPAAVVALSTRDRARRIVRPAFPRRRGRVVVVRDANELDRTVRSELVDAVLLDTAAGEEAWSAAARARELPGIPFIAIAPIWPGDAHLVARAVASECTDVMAEGVDDGVLAALVEPHRFTTRFAAALHEPPAALGLTGELQMAVWRSVVGRSGRPTTTAMLADHFRISREHLSRTFSAGGAPTLKRVIDLVRVCAAAELSKNPGYDVGDVARLLGFASSSHLAATTQRLVGIRPTSLARLRTVDLVARFSPLGSGTRPSSFAPT